MRNNFRERKKHYFKRLSQGFRVALLLFCILTIIFWGEKTTAASGSYIKEVKIVLAFPPGLYAGIRDRIQKSIEGLSKEVFLDKLIVSCRQDQAQISQKVKEILNRTLIGFTLKEISLNIDTQTTVFITLEARDPLVNEVVVNIKTTGTGETNWLFLQHKSFLQQQLSSFFLGLPVESLEWSAGLLEPMLKFTAQQVFPGFAIKTELTTGTTLTVNFTLEPNSVVLKDVKLHITSDSMPELVAGLLRKRVQESLAVYKGMPIVFLQVNEENLTREINKEVANAPWFSSFNLQTEVEWSFKETTEININVISSVLRWQVYSNIAIDGRDQMDLSLRAGRILFPGWSVVTEAKINKDLETDFFLGVDYNIWRQSELELLFSPGSSDQAIRLAYQIEPRTKFGITWEHDPNELVSFVQTKLNSHFSLIISAYPERKFNIDLTFNL